MWLPNCLEMAGDIQALPTVVTGGGDLLVLVVVRMSVDIGQCDDSSNVLGVVANV